MTKKAMCRSLTLPFKMLFFFKNLSKISEFFVQMRMCTKQNDIKFGSTGRLKEMRENSLTNKKREKIRRKTN